MARNAACQAPCTRCGDSPSSPGQPRAIWRAAAWRAGRRSKHAAASGVGGGDRGVRRAHFTPRAPKPRSAAAARWRGAGGRALRRRCVTGAGVASRCFATPPHAGLSPAPAPCIARPQTSLHLVGLHALQPSTSRWLRGRALPVQGCTLAHFAPPLPERLLHANMASHRRHAAALRVRVEEARGLLPLSDAPESDSPLLVTLRLAPGETTHSARTRAVRRGLEPVRVAEQKSAGGCCLCCDAVVTCCVMRRCR